MNTKEYIEMLTSKPKERDYLWMPPRLWRLIRNWVYGLHMASLIKNWRDHTDKSERELISKNLDEIFISWKSIKGHLIKNEVDVRKFEWLWDKWLKEFIEWLK